MKSILNELIYEIEGFGDEPKARITSFRQDPENPKKYFLEIEDLRERQPAAEDEAPDGGKTTEIAEGAENESN